MAENDTPDDVEQDAETVAPEASEATDETFDEARAREKIKKANSEAEGLRRRLRELEPLAEKAKALEDASKTDLERLEQRAGGAERERDEAVGEALRLRAAIRHGLDLDDLDLLGTGSEEQIEARAKRLAERAGRPGRPTERLRGGAEPRDEDVPVTKIVDQIVAQSGY